MNYLPKGINKFPNGFTGWAIGTFQTALTVAASRPVPGLRCDTLLWSETYPYLGRGNSINFYCGLLRNSIEGCNFFLFNCCCCFFLRFSV